MPTLLPLVDERVLLRQFASDDLRALRHWLQPGHEWQRWDGPYYPRMTGAQADAWIEALAVELDQDQPDPVPRLAVIDRVTGTFLGIVTWYFESEETNWRRIGISLYNPTSWSGGYGTEAVRLWTTYLFDSTDIVRLDFATWSGNVGMCRIGEKLGWTLEGRFRDARVVEGRLYDSMVYGVLRSEWKGQRGSRHGR